MHEVRISQPAQVMIATMTAADRAEAETIIRDGWAFTADRDPANKLSGYDNVFLSRFGRFTIIFQKDANVIQVASIFREPEVVASVVR